MSDPQLVPAQLHWRGDQPISQRYGDIYHASDGPEEVERIFIAPQALSQRIAAAPFFTIGEIGFGTGLNCAVIAQRFADHAPAGARLHIISVEKHPLPHDEFLRMAARRRRNLSLYGELQRCYPPLLAGWHRRHLLGGRLLLSLYFGDARSGLTDLTGRQRRPVDAWLLDGFAPDRNPQLWDPALWQAVAALSTGGTTLATFSAAGEVRRSLSAAGFAMRRIDQRPHKRHSLAGEFEGVRRETPAPVRHAVIAGAGLAGAATARQLAERGIAVTVLDATATPPNRIAPTLLHCRLPSRSGAGGDLRCSSYGYASHWYALRGIAPTGLLQFAAAGMDTARLESAAQRFAATGPWLAAVDPGTASALAGQPIRRSALYFTDARTLDLAALCPALLDHPLIEQRAPAAVTALDIDAARARVITERDTIDTDHVVLCAAAASNAFAPTRYLELVPVWGQIDTIRLPRAPVIPLVGDGFLGPMSGACGIGATYEHRPWPTGRASSTNLRRFAQWWRDISGRSDTPELLAPRRGCRAVSSDRNPIIGTAYGEDFAALPRLTLNTGHGSQGTSSAPFGAECIASLLSGEFAPATTAQLASVDSLRFRQRQLRRGPRHGASSR